MPFDSYLSRAPSFAALREPLPVVVAEKPSLFSRLFAKPAPLAPTGPITLEEFHALLATAPASKQSDRLYWVRHPEGDPWFAAEWKDEGLILLSTSYTHHRFLRNLGDLFDQGLRMAEQLKARLFEEASGAEVTAANVDGLLSIDGEYLRRHVDVWRKAIEALDTRVNAALEYPLGSADSVSEFFIFHVAPAREASVESMRAVLDAHLSAAKAEVINTVAMHVVGAEDEKGLAKVIVRPDGDWQIWPSHGQAPFARIATAVVEAAERVHGEVGGELLFRGRPYDDAMKREVRSRLDGLSVEVYAWAKELPEEVGEAEASKALNAAN